MSVQKISNAILGVGVDDTTIDLFESQYPVPTGVSYNSYVILDEKVAILDTVDNRATDAWLANLTEALGDRMPEYLVVSHMEPDHGANIARLAAKYPDMKVVGNAKTFVHGPGNRNSKLLIQYQRRNVHTASRRTCSQNDSDTSADHQSCKKHCQKGIHRNETQII